MDESKIKVLKALECDNDGNVVYEESFYINREDLQTLISELMGSDFDDVDDFIDNYEPEVDGVDIYEAAKERGMELEDCIEDDTESFADELDESDIKGFDSLDDTDFGDEEDFEIEGDEDFNE